jgi:DNA-binding NarL/FixJ family response regulator
MEAMPNESHRPANVLIVEDDHVYADKVIAPYFEDDWRVQVTYNVPQSLRAIDDIVDLRLAIVDLDIPGGSQDIRVSGGAGFEVMEVLKERFPKARIVVLTAHLTPMLTNKAQRMRVEYIAKGDCSTNLRNLAHDLVKAELQGDDEPAIAAAKQLAVEGKLSARQTEVLLMLVRSFSREEIAKELNISVWTLKSHTREIVRRTGFGRTQELIRNIRKRAQGA